MPLGPFYACDECFGPLEVGYDFPRLTRADIEAGPKNIWRYAPLLPVPADIASRPTTEPGYTRLIRADGLAAELGMRRLWIKDDSGNPTHSFKDRVVAVALAAATEMGFKVLACPSTGNLANAVAAAAARAGIRSVVMVPANLEEQKILTTAVYGGTFVTVDGTYDDVNRLASELAGEHEDWAFVNVNVRPYYAEGSKTLGFEIAEQLGWRLPDQIVVPVASGAQLVKIDKGFTELTELGLVDEQAVEGVRRAGDRLLAGVRGVRQRLGRGAPGQAGHDREVAGDRQPGRRPVRARRGPQDRRRGGRRLRRRGRGLDAAARPHPGRLRRDRGRRHRRRAAQAARRRASSTRTRKPSSSTRATGSRRSTRSRRRSPSRRPSSRRSRTSSNTDG